MTQTAFKGHIPGLDLIRVLAVLNVVLYHYTGAFERIFGWKEAPLVMVPYSVGVPAFFVLTGYLVPSLLERRSATIALYNRYARLLPALIACSLITTCFILLYSPRETEISVLMWLANLTMLPNIFGQLFLDGAYWTLQSQMYFFLFICILKVVGLLPRLHHVLIAVILFGLVAMKFELLAIPYELPTPYGQGINILLSFLQIGVVHFFAIGFVYRRFHTGHVGASEFLLLSLCIFYEWMFGVRVFPLFLLLLMVGFVAIFVRLPIYEWTPIRLLARISYCYYLLHMMIGFRVIHYFHYKYGVTAELIVPLTMGFIGLLAAVIERTVERPSYRFLRANLPSWAVFGRRVGKST